MSWESAIVKSSVTAREAIQAIDQAGLQIGLVVDDANRLRGVLTDGDVRRAILSSKNLDGPVTEIMQGHPRTINATAGRKEALSMMAKLGVSHLPIVEQDGRLVGLETLWAHYDTIQDETWVVLMAGGFGRRLAPLTDTMPKPMIKLFDRPILQHIIETLAERGFRRFFISVNYLADMIKSYFGDGSRWNVRIEYLEENEPLGTAGALSYLPQRSNGQVLVMNGDIFTNLDFSALVDFHVSQKNPATMSVRESTTQIQYGVIDFDGPHLTGIREKPFHTCYINAGIYVISSSALTNIPAGRYFDMPSLFQILMDRGEKPGVFPIREFWLDIGSHQDLERARREFCNVQPAPVRPTIVDTRLRA